MLGSVMNNESGGTSDDSLFASRLFTVDGTNRVVRYSPVTGSYVSGKPVTSNTSTSFTARNVKSGGTAIDFTCVAECSARSCGRRLVPYGASRFCRPVSTLRHARKGWLFQFFKNVTAKIC